MDSHGNIIRQDNNTRYDRLIQAMIFLYQADPDRVYLLGFSAGGDGVYQVTPRMADRFAAANMSSGHPNGVSLRNLMNCGFSIQVGIRDYYTEEALRCVRGAEMDRVLDDLHAEFGYGYPHQVLVHVPDAHNYDDYSDGSMLPPEFAEAEEKLYQEVLADPAAFADPAITEEMMYRFLEAFRRATGSDSVRDMSYTSAGFDQRFDEECLEIVKNEYHLETTRVSAGAVHYVSGFVRNPAPEEIFWDLSTRAPSRKVSRFYWLKAVPSVTEGTIHAAVTEDNGILVEPEGGQRRFFHPDFPDAAGPFQAGPDHASGGNLYGPGEPLHGDPGGLHAGDGGSVPGLGGGDSPQPADRRRRERIR